MSLLDHSLWSAATHVVTSALLNTEAMVGLTEKHVRPQRQQVVCILWYICHPGQQLPAGHPETCNRLHIEYNCRFWFRALVWNCLL
jgi:hypothetical protein